MDIDVKAVKSVLGKILLFIVLLWIIRIIDFIIPYDFCRWGILPRHVSGLFGIVFAPLLHANFYHLISNTLPIFILLTATFAFYRKQAIPVVLGIVIVGGSLVWIFGRSANHVGISGLIYGLAAFLVAAGIYKKDAKSIIVSIVIIALYGGLVWGVLPGKYWISWEGHLFGAASGVLMAFGFFKKEQRNEN